MIDREEILKSAIKRVIPEDWAKDLPGVTDSQITTVPFLPVQPNVSNVFLDVTVDGNKRLEQGFFVVGFAAEWPQDKIDEYIKVLFEEALAKLKEKVEQ